MEIWERYTGAEIQWTQSPRASQRPLLHSTALNPPSSHLPQGTRPICTGYWAGLILAFGPVDVTEVLAYLITSMFNFWSWVASRRCPTLPYLRHCFYWSPVDVVLRITEELIIRVHQSQRQWQEHLSLLAVNPSQSCLLLELPVLFTRITPGFLDILSFRSSCSQAW